MPEEVMEIVDDSLTENVDNIKESATPLKELAGKLSRVQGDVDSLRHRMNCLEQEAGVFQDEEPCEFCADKDDEIDRLEYRISELEDEAADAEEEAMNTPRKFTRAQLRALWEARQDSGAGPCWCENRGEHGPHDQHCFELRVLFRFHPCFQLGMFVPGDSVQYQG
jgi:predicted  nucleic acid-binding Zn-ribbon protein